MGLSRRQSTNEFKLAAIERLERGVSVAEVGRAFIDNATPNGYGAVGLRLLWFECFCLRRFVLGSGLLCFCLLINGGGQQRGGKEHDGGSLQNGRPQRHISTNGIKGQLFTPKSEAQSTKNLASASVGFLSSSLSLQPSAIWLPLSESANTSAFGTRSLQPVSFAS